MLAQLTRHGLAVLLTHHPSKRNPAPGQAGRGHGALLAAVDIMLELRPFNQAAPADRRRLLFGFSRFDDTPPLLSIELDVDGRHYTIIPEQTCSDFPDYWLTLRLVLEDAGEPLTRAQIRDRWAEGCPRPSIRTLWNWLNTACVEKLVAQSGTGHSSDPLRYWRPHKMAEWLADPICCLIHGEPQPEPPPIDDLPPEPPALPHSDDVLLCDPDVHDPVSEEVPPRCRAESQQAPEIADPPLALEPVPSVEPSEPQAEAKPEQAPRPVPALPAPTGDPGRDAMLRLLASLAPNGRPA